jgi:hypothetical protein
MVAGAVASSGAIWDRQRWEGVNTRIGVMLDWDDVQAVVTRALSKETPAHVLRHFREHGVTHLSIPELTLKRLLERGQLSLASGASPERVYLRAQSRQLAELLRTELRARLPHLEVRASQAQNPLISLVGDLPAVAEVGLGFDPEHFALAQEAGLAPVARPIGYSWVQPEMIERTLNQAAELGARIVAVQGSMTPGFEFNLSTTVEAMKQNRLCYAYFRESRHQRGDWYMAKSLAADGRVILTHEFEPDDLLLEDAGTISRRWANLALEAGVRLCCLRFFRVIHASDPMEAMDYVSQLTGELKGVGLEISSTPEKNLGQFLPERNELTLSLAGLSIAGAAGLAADLLPLPDELKLLGTGVSAAALAYLPFLESAIAPSSSPPLALPRSPPEGGRKGGPEGEIPGHHTHAYQHGHDHADSGHGHPHSHPFAPQTAYASKGLALAAASVYPAAAVAPPLGGLGGTNLLLALAQAITASTAGAITLNATLAEADYFSGVEEYRGYNLDWLLPLVAAAASALNGQQRRNGRRRRHWLPLAGVALMAWRALSGESDGDRLARWDREHRHAHIHHISAFQQLVGDIKLALAPQPLRKWSLLVPFGVVGAAIFRRRGQDTLAAGASTVATLGGVATMTGFRNMQRPFQQTVEGRTKGWVLGLALAGLVWLGSWLFNKGLGKR